MKEAHQVTFVEPNVDEEGKEITTNPNRDSKANTGQCRFCWDTFSTLENPCIVPCNCSGTVGFIHYLCLKNWL